MDINLRMVKKLKGNDLGRTKVTSRGRAIIEVSSELNQDLSTFGITVFHELMHVWTNIMRTNGAAIDMRKEHRFIVPMHDALAKNISHMRRKSHATNSRSRSK